MTHAALAQPFRSWLRKISMKMEISNHISMKIERTKGSNRRPVQNRTLQQSLILLGQLNNQKSKGSPPGRSASRYIAPKGQASLAKRSPVKGLRADGVRKFRYVTREWPGGVMRAPPRSTCWPIMNLPLYSPTTPPSGSKPG
jgi:hypothetical protein